MQNRTETILDRFQELNNVPRGSGNIDPPYQYLVQWAKDHGYDYSTDATQNIVIRVPATAGLEDRPTVIIQGHMDMVCEKTPGSKHDFMKDPVQNYKDGDWLRARETSLGADNGIALAMAFDLIENDEVKHPPMEILITTEEEVGMDGAHGLSNDFVKGRILINLDSEDEGIFTIGCAGGCDTFFTYPRKSAEAKNLSYYNIVIDGLLGGHSGNDINKGRSSAVEIMGRLVMDAAEKLQGRVASMDAGSGATNSIARRAELVLAIPAGKDFDGWLNTWKELLAIENQHVDKDLVITAKPCDAIDAVTSLEESLRLGEFMVALPQGVFGMSAAMKGLVETSSNVAGVRTTDLGYAFFGSQRSSVTSRLTWIRDRVLGLAKLAGCEDVRVKNKYPTWQPNSQSPLLAKCVGLYKEMYNKEPEVEAVHAGLEPGIFYDKYPGIDMISLGPTIENPHSPDEKLFIPTIQPVYEFLARLLAEI